MSEPLAAAPLLAAVRSSLLASGGPDLACYRSTFVVRRIGSRMRDARIASLADYASRLARDPDEAHRLIHALSIGVTRFRRDRATFDVLDRHLFPLLLAGRGPLRMLSAGSASGEEAWTLALAASEQARLMASKRDIRVEGFDLDRQAIERARAGRYPRPALAPWPQATVEHWFRREGDDVIAGPTLRGRVRFRHGDVLVRHGGPRYHLVLCRNLFIYLSPQGKQAALEALLATLVPGGYLVLGQSERLTGAAAAAFERPAGRERIYRLRAAA